MKATFLGFLAVLLLASAPLSAQTNQTILELKANAEKGDAESQLHLGLYYFGGIGMEKNQAEAMKWFHKAAEQGNSGAENRLGAIYRAGVGVKKDSAEAVSWYRKSAEQGNAEGQEMLGVCYFVGDGVDKDAVEAVKWYRKAAEQGDKDAQCALGLCYDRGDGVAKDSVEAVKWYQKGADQGDAESQLLLGFCYNDGTGIDINTVEAMRWFRRAANQGYAPAQGVVGACFVKGSVVDKDYVEAYKWFSLAKDQGDETAKNGFSFVEQQMTPEQISEAQKLVREFKPRKESSSDNSTSPENPTASGSGFFITDDGYLITNNHVVKDATKIRLATSAGTIDAKVVQVDAANDLALLKAVGTFSPLPIAASRSAHLGGTVATIGFPDPTLQGFSPKLAKGEIASLSGAGDDPRYFQISVPVQPGNSGMNLTVQINKPHPHRPD